MRAFVLALLFAVAPAAFAADPAPVALTLHSGEKKVIQQPELARIAVSNPKIADIAKVGDHGVQITAMKPGKTEVHVWDEAGARHIFKVTVKAAKK